MNDTTRPDADDDVLPDPAAVQALIDSQRVRVAEALEVDARLLCGTWGTAWLLGFGLQWLAIQGRVPDAVGGVGFATLLLLAGVVTAIHITRTSAGVRGTSARQGSMYGLAWGFSFVVVGALAASLSRLDVAPEVLGTVMTTVPALVVAALYMAGGALWESTTFFGLGAWIAVVTAVAVLVGGTTMPLVMALAGGGGMLAAAVVDHWRCHRGARRLGASA